MRILLVIVVYLAIFIIGYTIGICVERIIRKVKTDRVLREFYSDKNKGE